MIKHIEATKVQKAARSKTVCHSYSGATVGQLQKKFEENCQNDEYKTMIIHVGTNDLVHEDENHVAKKNGKPDRESEATGRESRCIQCH